MVATVDQMTQCTPLQHCLACNSGHLQTYLDLGWQELANDVHDGSIELGEFPLAVQYCTDCWHSQLTHAVDPDLLFKNYAYVSGTTGTLAKYFERFARDVSSTFGTRRLSVLDIAGNDGSLLTQFAALGHDVLNVDPAENLKPLSEARGVPVLCEYWGVDTYLALPDVYDVIVAMNVLGHVANPHAFLIGCRNALADGGVVYIQTSQCRMVELGQMDTLYHEHLSFFTAESFLTLAARAGLTVQSVEIVPVHGESYLWCLSRGGESDRSVDALLDYENEHGYYDADTYAEFGMGAESTATWLYQVVDVYRDADYAVVGYGAAAKGMTMLKFADVTLDCIVDDNPLKIGLLTPGTDIPIVNVEHLTTIEPPLCCVILSWNFAPEIIARVKAVRNRDDDIFVQYFPAKVITQ